MMLVASIPFQDSLLLTYLAGCVGATLLEYVTGVAMEKLFKVRYWDYSYKRFQFQGHICLSSTLAWGGLTIFMTHVAHRFIEMAVFRIPEEFLQISTILITVVFSVDFTLAFKAAMDLRNVLVAMEYMKEELLRMQKRADVYIAIANEDWAQKVNKYVENGTQTLKSFRETINNVNEAFEELLKEIKEKPTYYVESTLAEIQELVEKYKQALLKLEITSQLKDLRQKNLIHSHPGMTSKKFADSLEEIKQKLRVFSKESAKESDTREVEEK